MEKGRERWSAVRQIRTSSPILFTSNRERQTRHKTQIDGSSYEPVTLEIVDTASESEKYLETAFFLLVSS